MAAGKKPGRNANTKNTCTELANVFFELPTQHAVLELPLLTNVSSSRFILIILWLLLLLLLLSRNNPTTKISNSTSVQRSTTNLQKTWRSQDKLRGYSSLLWGQARHKGPAFIRYPFVSQQLEFPKPLHLPRMRGPTLILAQSGSRWGFPPHQPQPVVLCPQSPSHVQIPVTHGHLTVRRHDSH